MTNILKYRIKSAGSAYDLELGFVPDTVTVWNATKWATDGTKVKFYYHRGMAEDAALSEITEDTSANRAIETSNGFTILETSAFATGNQTVSGVTQAEPPVVTVGSTSKWTSGDQVRFHDIGGMLELNTNKYKITVINSTTFSLQDLNGENIDATGFTAFAAGTENNIAHNLEIDTNDGGFYGVTLGTAVVGSNDDILYVEAVKADEYTNIGDVA